MKIAPPESVLRSVRICDPSLDGAGLLVAGGFRGRVSVLFDVRLPRQWFSLLRLSAHCTAELTLLDSDMNFSANVFWFEGPCSPI
jgi:hypothetical protein